MKKKLIPMRLWFKMKPLLKIDLWKGAASIKTPGSKTTRSGTYNAQLKRTGG